MRCGGEVCEVWGWGVRCVRCVGVRCGGEVWG